MASTGLWPFLELEKPPASTGTQARAWRDDGVSSFRLQQAVELRPGQAAGLGAVIQEREGAGGGGNHVGERKPIRRRRERGGPLDDELGGEWGAPAQQDPVGS